MNISHDFLIFLAFLLTSCRLTKKVKNFVSRVNAKTLGNTFSSMILSSKFYLSSSDILPYSPAEFETLPEAF